MSPLAIAWTIVGIVVPVLIGAAFGVLSMSPPDFGISRVSFILASIILASITTVWATLSNNAGVWRISAAAFVGITIFIGLPESLRWVGRREQVYTLAQRQATGEAQRAKVVFQGASRVELRPDAIARVIFSNIGVHPAIDAQGQAFTAVANMLPPEGALENAKPVRQTVLSKMVIAPGNLVSMPVALNITDADRSNIVTGRAWLLLFGYITYDDGFNVHRRTRFCQFFNLEDGNWGACPTNNSFE